MYSAAWMRRPAAQPAPGVQIGRDTLGGGPRVGAKGAVGVCCGAALLRWICDPGAAMSEGGRIGERRSRGVDPKRPVLGW